MSAAIRSSSDPAEVRAAFPQPLPLPGPAAPPPFGTPPPAALPPASPRAPASPQPAAGDVAPERRASIEAWVRDNARPRGFDGVLHDDRFFYAGHDRVADALAGTSDLHRLSPPEQRLLLNRSLDVWQASGDTEQIGQLADSLAGKGALSQMGAHLYAERAASVAQGALGRDVAPDTRVVASTLAAGAMVAAGPRDAHAIRALVEGLGPAAAGGFADALDGSTTTAGSSMSGPDDQGRLAGVLGALNAGPNTAAGRSFVTHAFASATQWTYRDISVGEFGVHDMGQTNVAQPMAAALSRLAHPGDPTAQARDTARLGAILQSPAGAKLFAPDYSSMWTGPDAASDQVSAAARFQALDAVIADSSITARSLERHDSPWTDPQIAEGLARGHAQALLQARGDAAEALPGTLLENTVGVAMGLAPGPVAAGETAAQRAARERGIAAGTVSAYANARDAEPVRLAGDAVRAAAGQVGGDPAAPRVTVLPVQVATADSPAVSLPLFRVDGPRGERFVDNRGGLYASFADWQARNALPDGTMTFPLGGHLSADPSGRVRLASADTPETHDTLHHVEHVLDKAALVGGVIAGGAIVIGSGGTLAPAVLLAAGAYGAARSVQDLAEMDGRGRTLNPLSSGEARNAWLTLAASGLTGAGAVSGSLARAAAGTSVLSRTMAGAAVALNGAAMGADAAAVANQTVEAARNWDRMSPTERLGAGLNLAFWGLGARAQARGDVHALFDFDAQRARVMAESQAPVLHDPGAPGGSVAIQYDGAGGRLGSAHIVAGPGAKEADIALHQRQLQGLAEGSGAEGRVRRLFGNTAAPIRSRVWEANAEVRKLDEVIGAADRRLQAGGLSEPDRAQLGADLDAWRAQRAGHAADLERFQAHPALGAQPGTGVVEQPSGGRDRAAQLGRPEIPASGYHWAMLDGDLLIRPNGEAAGRPHLVWDDAQNRAVEAAGDPVRPTYAGDKESFTLPTEARRDVMAPLLLRRDQAQAEYQPLAALKAGRAPLTSEQQKALVRSQQGVTDASRELGEHGAAAYVHARYDRSGAQAELVYGGPGAASKSGDFDQVWRVRGADGRERYVVMEAKGGASPLGTRMVGDRAAMQGTRAYFNKIVSIMGKSGDASARGAAAELRVADDLGDVTYLEARTPVKLDANGRSSSQSVVVHEFDIRRPAQP